MLLYKSRDIRIILKKEVFNETPLGSNQVNIIYINTCYLCQ